MSALCTLALTFLPAPVPPALGAHGVAHAARLASLAISHDSVVLHSSFIADLDSAVPDGLALGSSLATFVLGAATMGVLAFAIALVTVLLGNAEFQLASLTPAASDDAPLSPSNFP